MVLLPARSLPRTGIHLIGKVSTIRPHNESKHALRCRIPDSVHVHINVGDYRNAVPLAESIYASIESRCILLHCPRNQNVINPSSSHVPTSIPKPMRKLECGRSANSEPEFSPIRSSSPERPLEGESMVGKKLFALPLATSRSRRGQRQRVPNPVRPNRSGNCSSARANLYAPDFWDKERYSRNGIYPRCSKFCVGLF